MARRSPKMDGRVTVAWDAGQPPPETVGAQLVTLDVI
jgi:hypothetical protein